MPKLPIVTGREAIGALEKVGYRIVRQKGSHIRLRDDTHEQRRPLSVPDHKELKLGLLRRLIHDADLSVEEFIELIAAK